MATEETKKQLTTSNVERRDPAKEPWTMAPYPNGQWVRFADFETVVQERDEAVKAAEILRTELAESRRNDN
jgi:hypothetical protein